MGKFICKYRAGKPLYLAQVVEDIRSQDHHMINT